nr:MAG: minor tail protein [Bacteriophage sp.]
MAIIKYPDWLPLAQRASKNLTQQTPFRSDQPAVGTPIFQKLTTDIAATWSLTWKFTLAEERAFIQWLRSSNYLNKCNNWFTMMIDLGGSGLQEQTLHFTDYPVQTSIDGGVVTWTGNVIAKKLNNTMDEFDDVLVELDYRWYNWLDEVVSRELPQVYMTPILHMPINMLSSTLDSRVVYDGPQVYYINRNGNLVQSAANEWPLTFIDGVAVGRVPPESASSNILIKSSKLSDASWTKTRTTVSDAVDGFLNGGTFSIVPNQTTYSHLVYQSVSSAFAEGDVYTLSYVAKAYGYNYAGLIAADDAGFIADCVANLSTGVIYAGAPDSDIAELGNGWYRFTETVAIRQGGASSLLLAPLVYNNSAVGSFAGDGVSGILVCAMQIEKSPFATSPIVTDASPSARPMASAKVVMNGATSIDITYSDGSVVNVQAVDDYAAIPRADSAWGSKYITTIKFNV